MGDGTEYLDELRTCEYPGCDKPAIGMMRAGDEEVGLACSEEHGKALFEHYQDAMIEARRSDPKHTAAGEALEIEINREMVDRADASAAADALAQAGQANRAKEIQDVDAEEG